MAELGRVAAIDGANAVVRFKRRAECEKCGACKVLNEETIMTIPNSVNAAVGDVVEIELQTGVTAKAAFLSYGVMLAALCAGIFVGALLGRELYSVLFAVIFLLLTYPLMIKFGKIFKKPENSPSIVRIQE